MVKYNISFLPEADNDLEEILEWYSSFNHTICEDIIAEIENQYQNLQSYPNMFPEDFLFVKKIILRKFPYKICFVIDDARNEIIIIGILHQKRDSRIIQERINFE